MSAFKQVEYASGETVESVIENTIIMPIHSRSLRQETCEHYGIRTGIHQQTGQPEAHYFPIYRGKRITGFIKRDLTKPKKRGWSVVGDITAKDGMFGQHCLGTGRKLWITEGVYDAPSAWQSLYDNQKNPGQYIPSVVSISLGTKKAVTNITHNLKALERFTDKVLVFDNDQATPEELAKGEPLGQDAAKKVCLTYPDFKNVVLPDEVNGQPVKDSSDLLLIDSVVLYKQLMFNAVDFAHDAVLSGVGLTTQELMVPVGRGFMVPDLPETMRLLHGLRDREMTIVLAPPKCGKTTLCRLINYRLLEAGVPTLGIYLEEDYKKTIQSFVALDNKVHLPRLREEPGLLKPEDYQRTVETLLRPEIAHFYNGERQKLTPQGVIDMLLYASSIGVKRVILDHLSYVFSGQASTNERKDIDLLLTEIADVIRATGLHVIVVSHIARKLKTPPMEKGQVVYPWWYQVDETDARGSGSFEQITSNMVAIEKQITEDGSRGFSRTKVLLAREWDWTGVGDVLTVDQNTGWMKTVDYVL